MMCIVLTSAQVNTIFGALSGQPPQAPLLMTSSASALQPRQLATGDWAIAQAAIASDPSPSTASLFSGLPTRDVAPADWAQDPDG